MTRPTTPRRSGYRAATVALTLLLTAAHGALAPSGASAVLPDAPARTWGVGPAQTTSASSGDPRVLAILPVGDRIVVGGTFDSVIDPAGKEYPAKNIAVFSASTGAADLSFTATANNSVTSLATDGLGTVFLGGTFGVVNGETRRGLAALDLVGGRLRGWAPSVVAPGQVDSLTYAGGSVFAGGNFAGIASSPSAPAATSKPFLAKVDAVTGTVASSWSATPNDRVRTLTPAADGTGRLFLGGDFTSVSGRSSTNKIAAVSLSAGALDPGFRAGPANRTNFAPVFDLVADGARLYAAAAGGGGACTALSAVTGAQVWSDGSNGNLQSVRLSNGLLYCGGHFSGAGSFMGQTRHKLAAVDPATGALTPFAPNINSSQGVWSMAADARRVYVGGDFSAISGTSQPHFAMFIDSSAHTVPRPPEGLTAAAGDGAVHLSWSPPSSDGGSPLQKYRLYRATTPGGQDLGRRPLATLAKSTLTYEDTSVTNGTTYHYVVVATTALGPSGPSVEVAARPLARAVLTVPSAPSGLGAVAAPGGVTLTWSPPASTGGAPLTEYRIHRNPGPGGTAGWSLVGRATTTTFEDVTESAGVPLAYRVTAVNAIGEGPASAQAEAVPLAGVPGRAELTGSVSALGAAVLRWTIPPDGGSPITKYVILRDSVRLVTLPAPASGDTSYLDVTLLSGSTATYQVKAVNDVGGGPLSAKVTLTAP